MDIFLLRHGEAADLGGKIKSDAARPLTDEGIKLMNDEAEGMKRLGLRFNAILTSPLIRAKETAQIVADILDCSRKLHVCEALGMPVSIPDLMEAFKPFQNDYRILLVGHMPDMGKLAGHFIGNNKFILPFKKGSLAKIEVERLVPTPRGELRWFVSARQLKLIGQS
jgi:phosphohistidine phosphatase